MTRVRFQAIAAGLLSAACMAAVGAGTAPVPARAASAASAPHVSPYVRAARQHALEASAAAPKSSPLLQHRPRLPASLRHG